MRTFVWSSSTGGRWRYTPRRTSCWACPASSRSPATSSATPSSRPSTSRCRSSSCLMFSFSSYQVYKQLAVQNPILSSLQHFRIILSYWVFWVQAFYLVQSSRPSMVQTSPGARSRTWSCWRNGIEGNQNRNRFKYCHCATCDLKVLIVWIVLCMQNADRKIKVHKTQTDSYTSTQYLKWNTALTH